MLVEKDNKTYLWEPFTCESSKVYKTTRNIYKSIYGNKIIFEGIQQKRLECLHKIAIHNDKQLNLDLIIHTIYVGINNLTTA